MIYNKLGNTDLKVSKLGHGLMRLTLNKYNPDFNYSSNLIKHAMERGINFFDIGTFYCHGHCEQAFGTALNSGQQYEIILSGKNSCHQSNNFDWQKQLHNTLKVFNKDQLDIYFLHYLGLEVWTKYFIEKNIFDKLVEAKEQGLFKYLGFSSHDSPENVKSLINTGIFDAVILQYNMIETKYEQTIKFAKQKGLGVIIMNATAGGILENPTNFSKGEIECHDIKLAAFEFVMDNPNIDCILSGMRTISEIDENVKIITNPNKLIGNLAKVKINIEKIKKSSLVICTRCKYCLPCTQGIDIPEVIDVYNKYGYLNGKNIFSREYSLLEINASSCIECGTCENRCPNDIEILRIMKESSEKFND